MLRVPFVCGSARPAGYGAVMGAEPDDTLSEREAAETLGEMFVGMQGLVDQGLLRPIRRYAGQLQFTRGGLPSLSRFAWPSPAGRLAALAELRHPLR